MNTRSKVLFWSALTACLLLGLGRILVDPTQPARTSAGPVIITEFVANNGSGLTDEDGEYSDWIELHNRSGSDVDLAEWSLTDDPTQPEKWVFRSITLPRDEYLIVFASGKNRRTIQPNEGRPYPHTSFKLDSAGGYLALFSPTSRRFLDVSEFEYPQQVPDVSYGALDEQSIVDGQSHRYFANPTPGASNDESTIWLGIVPPVSVGMPHGFYSEPFALELTTTDPEATIHYTTDGSVPGEESRLVYYEPISVTGTTALRAAAFRPDFRRSAVTTQTYLFLDDVVHQTANQPDFPDTWGTHTIDFGGYRTGDPVQADYGMDPEIVDDPQFGSLLRDGLQSIPTLSLVTSLENLDIYATPRSRGPEVERPVSVELIYTDPAQPGFQIDAGVRIQGGAGRWEFMPKHSFRLFFKKKYGASKLNYPMFADSPVREFDTLVLRAGVDRSYAGHPSTPEQPVDHRQATYTRDEWVRSTQAAISGVGSHGLFVHLYINGLYWGLYNVVERPDASFASAYLGGEKEQWFTANHGGAVSGQIDRFNVMLQLAEEGGLSDPEKYATMLEFVDPIQFSDYLIANWYAGNYDWPENNWYVDVQNPAGRNLFFVWDAEGTWDEGARIKLGPDAVEGAPYPNVVKLVFKALMENPEFRLTFADRVYKHLHGEGVLTDANARVRWQRLNDVIEHAIVAESARWGDVRYDDPITLHDWRTARDLVLAQMDGNAAKMLELVRQSGFYPAVDPPDFSQQTGVFSEDMVLEMQSFSGTIFYTSDGSDPRTPGTGMPSPSAQEYRAPVVLTTTTTVKARVLEGDAWSAVNEAQFRRAGQKSDLRITEIMYNPSGDEEMEFLELQNIGDLAIDLSGAYFEGIFFRFADGALLEPGQYAVLFRDLKKFRRRYPDVEVAGRYEGKLSDRGETIMLRSADGTVLASVTYDDENGWPLSADGTGDSLVLAQFDGSANDPQNWRASVDLHGSPGDDDPVP